MLKDRFGTHHWYEALLGGHAIAGQAEHVGVVIAEVHATGQYLTRPGYSLIPEGFLQRHVRYGGQAHGGPANAGLMFHPSR